MKKNGLINTLFLRCTSEWLAFGCALFPQHILKIAFLLLPLLLGSQNTEASVGLRIVSLAPDLTEIVYALGLEDSLVGVSDYSDFPEAAHTKPSVGSFIAPSLEKILLLHPTVVLVQSDATPSHITHAIQAQKISLLSFKARHENDIYETLKTVGQKFRKEKKALALITQMKKTFLTLQKPLKKHSVLIQIEETPVMVAGENTLLHRAIILAGGKNAAQKYLGYPKLQREVLLKLNPDMVILPQTQGQEEKIRSMKNHWEKNKIPVTVIPSELLTRATPRFCEGVQKLASSLSRLPK